MPSRVVRAGTRLVATIAAVVALGAMAGYIALADEPSGVATRQAQQVFPAQVGFDPILDEAVTCLADAEVLPVEGQAIALVASYKSMKAAADVNVKVKCTGRIVDYTIEIDSTNKKIVVTITGGANFKGCTLQIKEPAPGFKNTATGFEVPYDKDDVKVKVEGAFTCKKADGTDVVVPIDTLEFTFRPPGTIVYPLK